MFTCFIFQYVRTGKNPLKQLTNGLARNRHLRVDRVKCEKRNGKHALPSFEDDLKRVRNNGQNLQFKATHLVRFFSTSFMDHAVCEGVEITNKYKCPCCTVIPHVTNIIFVHLSERFPNNIVWVRDVEDGDQIAVITSMNRNGDSVTIVGHQFRSKALFKTPFDSRTIGVYLCHLPRTPSVCLWKFDDIVSKIFPLPINITKKADPLDVHQSWIMTSIRHCEV